MLSKHIVYCLPAADEADEIVASMLAQLLGKHGFAVRTVICRGIESSSSGATFCFCRAKEAQICA
jgi:predicted alpha/beta hydrolase